MKLLITGDLTLQGRAASCDWNHAAIAERFADVKNIADGCDHAIVNLESPVTDAKRGIMKDGPVLKNRREVFDIIKYCGFDVVTLANNHLKDYGRDGVTSTLESCEKQNVKYVGAGKNLRDARKPLTLGELSGGGYYCPHQRV